MPNIIIPSIYDTYPEPEETTGTVEVIEPQARKAEAGGTAVLSRMRA